jgi:hypothetical protein
MVTSGEPRRSGRTVGPTEKVQEAKRQPKQAESTENSLNLSAGSPKLPSIPLKKAPDLSRPNFEPSRPSTALESPALILKPLETPLRPRKTRF